MSGIPARAALACAAPLACLYRSYYRTLHVVGLLADGTTCTPDAYPFPPEIYAVSERDSFALAGLVSERRFTVLVTLGRDGDWVSAVLERLGCRIVRGSSKGGGRAALAAMIRDQRESPGATAIVVDGPLGPVGVAKAGASVVAAQTGRPLYAISAAARRSIVIHSTWAGMFIPVPFTAVAVAVEAIAPPASLAEDDVRASADAVTAGLRRARARAEAYVARTRDVSSRAAR